VLQGAPALPQLDTVAAVEAGVAVLVHTPHIGRLEDSPDTVRMIAKAGSEDDIDEPQFFACVKKGTPDLSFAADLSYLARLGWCTHHPIQPIVSRSCDT
jgi:hypothetical protein